MLLLIPGLPAIGDLGQQGPDPLDVFFTPKPDTHSAYHDCFRRRNLPSLNVAGKSCHADAKLLCNLLSGELRHSGWIVPDRLTSVKIISFLKVQYHAENVP